METESGICLCGCGAETTISKATGRPNKFIRGHNGGLNATKTYAAKIRTAADGAVEKLCTFCGQHKVVSELNFGRSKSRREPWRSHCRECERSQATAHYRSDPKPYIKKAIVANRILRAKLGQRLDRIKRKYGCRLCGLHEPVCLDLHHLIGKDRHIGGARGSVARFERELVRCVVLCANCHRKVHGGLAVVSRELLCRADDCKEDVDAIAVVT